MALVTLACCALVVGCTTWFGTEDFQDHEAASDQFLSELPLTFRSQFVDEGHALAYALATDCFNQTEPVTPLDVAVQTACETDWGLLSDVMTMPQLCGYLRLDGNRSEPQVNGEKLCG